MASVRTIALATLFALTLIASGCGAILNSSTAVVNGPPGTTVNGAPVPVVIPQRGTSMAVLPNGQTCAISSSVSAGYVILDILFTGLIGIIIDAATEDWKVADADGCPGLIVD